MLNILRICVLLASITPSYCSTAHHQPSPLPHDPYAGDQWFQEVFPEEDLTWSSELSYEALGIPQPSALSSYNQQGFFDLTKNDQKDPQEQPYIDLTPSNVGLQPRPALPITNPLPSLNEEDQQETLHKCPYSSCLVTAKQRCNLMRHYKTQHISLTPYFCKLCQKPSHNNNLRRYRSKRRESVLSHVRKSHRIEDEKQARNSIGEDLQIQAKIKKILLDKKLLRRPLLIQ